MWRDDHGADGLARRSSSVSRGVVERITANSIASDRHGPPQDDRGALALAKLINAGYDNDVSCPQNPGQRMLVGVISQFSHHLFRGTKLVFHLLAVANACCAA